MVTLSTLDHLLDPLTRTLRPEAARSLADFRLDPAVAARLEELAGRCNEGSLTESERAEYEDYADAIGLIEILKAKAMHALARQSVA